MVFLIWPARRVIFSLYIYTSQYLIESFTAKGLFSFRTDAGKQIIAFFDTNYYYSLTYTNCAVRVQVLCSANTTNYKHYNNF